MANSQHLHADTERLSTRPKPLRAPPDGTNVDRNHIPISALSNISTACRFAQVAHGNSLTPDVVYRASGPRCPFDDDVTVREVLRVDAERREPFPAHVEELLGLAQGADHELLAVVFVPHRRDVRAPVGAHGSERGDMRLVEEGFHIWGEDRHGRISSRPVRRVKSSLYRSSVPSTISGGSSGPGGSLFQPISSR